MGKAISWEALEAAERRNLESHRRLAACRRLPRVLVIEDDEEVRAGYLRELGEEVELVLAVDSPSALWQISALPPDLILSDSIGLAALRELRAQGDNTPAVLISGRPYHPASLATFGPIEIKPKPVFGDGLRAIVQRYCQGTQGAPTP